MRPAVFLDRDGILNERTLLPARPSTFRIRPDAPEAMRRLASLDCWIVVATNQPYAGTLLPWRALGQVHDLLRQRIAAAGGRIDRIYVATGLLPNPRRKPNPGMLREAAADLGIDLTRSWMIGDKAKDVEAGRRAGCRTILANPAPGERSAGERADAVAENLLEAVEIVERVGFGP